MRQRVSAIVILASGLVGSAHAEDRPITIETPGERTSSNIAVGASVAGAGVIAGAIGLYFHLDSRSHSDDVKADTFTGKAWTSERQDMVDSADDSRTRAIVGYSIGGALLLGAAVYWILTDPPSETVIIQPRRLVPTVAPTPGGAMLGGTWSF